MNACDLNWECFLSVLQFQFSMNIIRYFPIAGGAFLVIWIWKKDWFQPFRIQQLFPKRDKLLFEIKQSFTTLVMFTLVGMTTFVLAKTGIIKTYVYRDIDVHGWSYAVASFFLVWLWQETWFYWIHRAMHTKFLYRWVHSVHHKSVNPSPLAAYSFHSTEAVLEAIYLPIFILVVPLHFNVLLIHTFFVMLLNIYFHTGYEFYSKNWLSNPVLKWINPSTHHNLHHSKFHGNYSLYLNFWDKIMGTNFPHYESYYREVVERREKDLNERKGQSSVENIPFPVNEKVLTN